MKSNDKIDVSIAFHDAHRAISHPEPPPAGMSPAGCDAVERAWNPRLAEMPHAKPKLYSHNAEAVIEALVHQTMREREQIRALQSRIDVLEIDLAGTRSYRDGYRRDYEGAAKQVAEMHEAAVGMRRGPIVGLVADVANVRAALVAEQARNAKLVNKLRRGGRNKPKAKAKR